MLQRCARAAALAGVLVLVACKPDPEANNLCAPVPPPSDFQTAAETKAPLIATGTVGATWFGGIKNVIKVRCQTCHAFPPRYGAPMPFVLYEDTQVEMTPGTPLYQRMIARIKAESGPMPPISQPRLTPRELEVFEAWVAEGAPLGDEANDPGEVEQPEQPAENDLPPRPITRTIELLASDGKGDSYKLPVAGTSYACFAFKIPDVQPGEHVVRFEPIIDNVANVHHAMIYRNQDEQYEENKPFDCNGFPVQWEMVAGWSPGRKAESMPPGVGVRVDPEDQMIVQVHYNGALTPGLTDRSGYRISLSDEPCLAPAAMMWGGVIWGEHLNGLETLTSVCTLDREITLFSVFPHMHTTGTSIGMEVRRGGTGRWQPLFNIEGWSADEQPNVHIPAAQQVIKVGDQLRTTCQFNTRGRTIAFGENTSDEMCFTFMYHYPEHPSQFYCITAIPAE